MMLILLEGAGWFHLLGLGLGRLRQLGRVQVEKELVEAQVYKPVQTQNIQVTIDKR